MALAPVPMPHNRVETRPVQQKDAVTTDPAALEDEEVVTTETDATTETEEATN